LFISSIRDTHTTHLIVPYLITLNKFGEVYKLWSS
jgi:hypothetical protein